MGAGELVAVVVSGIESDRLTGEEATAFAAPGACDAAVTVCVGIGTKRQNPKEANPAINLQRLFMNSSLVKLRL
jgi:hypothetical protein